MRFSKNLATVLGLAVLAFSATGCEQMRVDAEVRRLCAQDGGVHVYEAVTLAAEDYSKYSKDNWRRIPAANAARDTDEYFWDTEHRNYHRPGSNDWAPLEMLRLRATVIRRRDNKILGEEVTYIRTGGDYGPGHPSHFTCPALPHGPDDPQLFTSVFVKGK